MQKKYSRFKIPFKLDGKKTKQKDKKNVNFNKVFQEIENQGEDALDSIKLTTDLEDNLKKIKEIFKDCYDAVFRTFTIGGEQTKCFLVYLDGMAKKDEINENILRALMTDLRITDSGQEANKSNLIKLIKDTAVSVSEVKDVNTAKDVVKQILLAGCILFVDGYPEALAFGAKGWQARSIGETKVESVIRGPAEGFVEDIKVNVTQIRRRIKTPDLKMESFEVGRLSKTIVVMAYIKGIAEEAILEEVRLRINRIDTDVILESGYLEQFIEDSPWSPFPTMEMSERPDGASLALSDGRIVIMVDTTPFVIIVPAVLTNSLVSAEDNYARVHFTIFMRLLRYVAFAFALLGPSLYIAITTFHQEMIPTSLLIAIATSRAEVPFPAIIEALLMELTFEILREAGERLPRTVGQALSIVGALVIGQTAVQAGLVSQVMVIVVSVTAISSFVIPKFNLGRAVRILRFPIMFLAATLGIFGLIMGILALMIHLVSLRSFGVPFLSPIAPLNAVTWKNIIIKMPHPLINKRSTFIQNNNIIKTNKDSIPKPPKKD